MNKKIPYPELTSADVLIEIFSRLREKLPPCIGEEDLAGISATVEDLKTAIGVLKFLSLVDESASITDLARELFSSEAAFEQNLRKIVRSAYADLFDFHGPTAWTTGSSYLAVYFIVNDLADREVCRRRTVAFEALAAMAGTIEKYPQLKPYIADEKSYHFDETLLNREDGLVIVRFYALQTGGYAYVVWSRGDEPLKIELLEGLYRVDSIKNTPRLVSEITANRCAKLLVPCAPQSPVIESIRLEGDPIEPIPCLGDLWLNTWADDGDLYSGWGDGTGLLAGKDPVMFTDCGIMRLTGDPPEFQGEERCFYAPVENPGINEKPSSLLFMNGQLYAHFHSPLGDAWIGYLAVSDDHGATWEKVGYYEEFEKPPANASPWTRKCNSPFRCLFLINMGKNYELNEDGYVYGMGIGTEWSWTGGLYLARAPIDEILHYDSYQYFSGMDDGAPKWVTSQFRAVQIPGVSVINQASVMYHPQLQRFLLLTDWDLYDSPAPWGPWTYAGSWLTEDTPEKWQGGYMPGIISKDTDSDSFWFTLSGQNTKPKITYSLNLGKIVMELKD